MNTSISALLGIAFAVLGTGTVFLMFHLWGYPFDKATRTSAAPKSLMLLHRAMGYAFFLLYLVMMAQMVPRLFRYQVEFPPRTVVHIVLGITIGFLLMVKISILRFFRHLEEWMPFLGVALLLCTYLLIGLSVPFSLRERFLASAAAGGDVVSPANLERLRKILPTAGLPAEAPVLELASKKGLLAGREILLKECVACHDLRTILVKPRPPKDWVHVVERMAEKPLFGDALSKEKQWAAATYLIAISPQLQESAKKMRDQKAQSREVRLTATTAMESPEDETPYDAAKAKSLFETKCAECHETTDVDEYKFTDAADVKEVMQRMLDNGLEGTPAELDSLRKYVELTYLKTAAQKAGPKEATAKEDAAAVKASAGDGTVAKKPATPKTSTKDKPADETKPAEAAAPSAAAEAAQCGKAPLPPCPMQAWMKANAASASATGDLPQLATVLDRIAKMAPPGFGTWASLSQAGAAAARAGDLAGARASCTNCHNVYRAKYKSEMRARPLL